MSDGGHYNEATPQRGPVLSLQASEMDAKCPIRDLWALPQASIGRSLHGRSAHGRRRRDPAKKRKWPEIDGKRQRYAPRETISRNHKE